MKEQDLIPTTILTGFLGAGKTTLLQRVLSEAHGEKIVVIENELGQENIDHELLVAQTNEVIFQMSNGCVCCSIRDDLRQTLADLATQRRKGTLVFDRVILETTGLADPGPVIQTFFMDDEVAQQYRLDAVLTVVDAKHAMQQLDQRLEAQRQVGFADHLLISKVDLVDTANLKQLETRLHQMNPRAPQHPIHFGNMAFNKILDLLNLKGFHLNEHLTIMPTPHDHDHDHDACHDPHCHDHHHHHHHHHDDVKSFVFQSTKPFDLAKLEDFLGAIIQVYGPKLYRYKGILSVQGFDRKVIFQGVHQLMGTDQGSFWSEGALRESKLVFIGQQLPKDIIMQGLNQSLVDEVKAFG